MKKICLGVCLIVFSGCMSSLEEQTKATGSKVIGKKTKDVKKWDPDAEAKIDDLKFEVSDPVLGPLEAYGPTVGKIAKIGADHFAQLYEAEHGRLPTYEEFMEGFIEQGGGLPVLPGEKQYFYRESDGKLLVVEKAEETAP